MNPNYDVIIIGAGPAGLTAAIYCSQAKLKTLVIERSMPGGRMTLAPLIVNYPGFPDGIRGVELANLMFKQAEKYGAKIVFDEVVDVNVKGSIKKVRTRSGKEITSYAIIIATGLTARRGLIRGEEKFLGKGLSYCAVCDGPLYKGKRVALVAFTDKALEEAKYLAELVRELIFIAEDSNLTQIAEQELKYGNVRIVRGKAKSLIGDGEVKGIIVDVEGREERFDVDGVFIAAKEVPSTEVFRKAGIEIDERGFVKVNMKQETNIPGIYACGDVTGLAFQVSVAIGQATVAALRAINYIRSLKH